MPGCQDPQNIAIALSKRKHKSALECTV